jgi:hypothetical protein
MEFSVICYMSTMSESALCINRLFVQNFKWSISLR